MKIDLLFDPFGATWHDVQEGAIAAEGEGFDGVWLYDHLAGSVHGQQRVLECWTTLTAIAATVPRRRQAAGWTRPGPPGGDSQGVSGCFGAPLVSIRRHRVFGPERSGARATGRTGRRSSCSLRYPAIRQPRPPPGRQPALTTHQAAS